MSTTTHNTKFPRTPTSSLPGVKRFVNAVWYRSKAKLKDVLEHTEQDLPAVSRQTHWVPPEVWDMIIVHFAYDVWTLKACATTCFTWYNIATPHLHHTLKLRQWTRDASHAHLNPLESLHKLDLSDFVKRVEFETIFGTPWVNPAIFDSDSLQYFHGLNNLQDLTIANLDFSKFPMGAGKYFGHFSPTLRSISLSAPRGTRRQLLDFFGLFPKLDDVEILNYLAWAEERGTSDILLVPMEGRLRGRLTLKHFDDEELLKDMIVAYGGMWFTSMELHDVQGIQPVLEACASTLERVYIQPGGAPRPAFPQLCDLSRNTALRSLELVGSSISNSPKYVRTLKQLLSTITSPTFSEVVVVFSEPDVRWPPRGLVQVLRDMHDIKEFRVAFCLETLEGFMAPNLRGLTLNTKRAAALGTYDFLSCSPFVFARAEARHDRLSIGGM